jgi:hypothetical protein
MAWFDPSQHDAAGAFGGAGMPIGKYPVVIVGSSVASANSNANSGKLVLSMQVLDGPNKDHKGDWNLNLFNENEQARQIAGRQLAAVCAVTQTRHLDQKPEGVELWNKPFMIEFRKQPKDEKYTECCGVWDVAGNPPAGTAKATSNSSAPPQQFAQASAPAPAQAPAWQQPAQPAAQPQQPTWGAPSQPTAQPTQGAPAWSQQPAAGGPAWSQQPAAGGPAPWGAR